MRSAAPAARTVNTVQASGGKQSASRQAPSPSARSGPAQRVELATPACEGCQSVLHAAQEVQLTASAWIAQMRDAVDDARLHHHDQNTMWLILQRAAGIPDAVIFQRVPSPSGLSVSSISFQSAGNSDGDGSVRAM
jgi:hypothetical protein